MKIFWLTGGIGNQLFIFAASLNVRSESKVYFDLGNFKYDFRDFKLDKLGFQLKKANWFSLLVFRPKFQKLFLWFVSEDNKPIYINEVQSAGNCQLFNSNRISYFQGYWQQTVFYKDVLNIMRLRYKLPNKYKSECYWRIFEKIKNFNTIAVHIRRTDYLNDENSRIFNILEADYYNNCISSLSKKIEEPKFFVFSEDIIWAKENLNFGNNSVFFVSEYVKNDILEFDLMRQCNHAIIANSTFSWWAAELNEHCDKIIFAPKQYFSDLALQEKYANKEILFNISFIYR